MTSLFFLLFAVAPLVDASPLVQVIDVMIDNEKLDGKTVRVEGWLKKCRPTACYLSDGRGDDAARIALGDSASFDRAVRKAIGQRIAVEGVVNTMGFEHWSQTDDGGSVVTWPTVKPGHRIGQLAQPRLISILPRE